MMTPKPTLQEIKSRIDWLKSIEEQPGEDQMLRLTGDITEYLIEQAEILKSANAYPDVMNTLVGPQSGFEEPAEILMNGNTAEDLQRIVDAEKGMQGRTIIDDNASLDCSDMDNERRDQRNYDRRWHCGCGYFNADWQNHCPTCGRRRPVKKVDEPELESHPIWVQRSEVVDERKKILHSLGNTIADLVRWSDKARNESDTPAADAFQAAVLVVQRHQRIVKDLIS